MNDNEFNKLSEILFIKLEDLLDNLNIEDTDIQTRDNVLIIDCNNNEIYINKHHVTKQIWVSSQNKAYHFDFDGSNWISTTNKQEIFIFLSKELSNILGYKINLIE